MRRILFAAAALGPLCLAVSPSFAASIADARTTPIATSTAGAAGGEDVALTVDGSIKLTAPGTAVTLDSNNSVNNGGLIQFDNANNAVGVAIQGGRTGGLTNTGTINVIEDFTPPDANNDGIFESPQAVGTGRYGVRLTGSSPFVGSLTNSGSIFVEGNDSAGVSIEAPLQGSIIHSGTIGVTGDRSFGLHTTAPVSGDISLTGAIGAAGTAATGVSIQGNVGGALKIYSSISANGYANSVRPTVADSLTKLQGTPSEMQQSGASLVVGADVAGGVYLGAPPAGTPVDGTVDGDLDGIPDAAEATGSITNFGSAPAVLVGGAGRSVSIGAFGAGNNAYGLLFSGAITTTGLYDGVASTGVQIGGTGSPVVIAGGLRLVGSVVTSSYEANTTGLLIGAGAVVPEFRNENSLSVSVLNSLVTGPTASTATALQVDAGASLPRITNYGVIAASATGPNVSATAVVDRSGSVSVIDNQGLITSSLSPVVADGPVGGRTIALDLRANTTGVTLTQTVNTNPLLLPSGATTPISPGITGDILLGSGPNTVSLQAGTVTGALDLGSGASSLSIGGGAIYTGVLSHTGSALTIDVASGSLINKNASTYQLQSLNVGATGVLSFAVDPSTGKSTSYQVAGPATLASGAKIGINLLAPINAPQRYVLISSPTLTLGSVDTLQAESPYAIITALSVDTSAGALNLDLRRRTAAEAGFDPAQTAAYDAISAALPKDLAVQSALFTPQDRAGFIGVYNQLLPDYGGGTFRMAALAARTISRITADTGPAAAWVQEISVGARQESGHDAAPYRALGFGFAGGLERDSSIGVLGVKASFITGDSQDHDLAGDGRSTLTDFGGGFYWRASAGGLKFDASAGAGYVRSTYRRQLLVTDAAGTETLNRTAEGKAGGWSTTGRIGVGYQAELGAFYLRPQAHLDYYRLQQGAYTESGGGDAFDLSVDKRTGKEASGTASVVFGANFGQGFSVRPELEVGYRNIFSGGPGVLRAHFTGGDTFNLYALGLADGGPMARLSLRAGGETYDFSLGAGVEKRDSYMEGDVQFKVRLLF